MKTLTERQRLAGWLTLLAIVLAVAALLAWGAYATPDPNAAGGLVAILVVLVLPIGGVLLALTARSLND
jgi:TRAP-type C4-dicarboxylate transport system permease small subunit